MRGAATAVQLMEGALEESTYAQYGRLFAEFATYCEGEGVSPLPASPWTVIAYVGFLAEKGTWAADSLQPIFSAINGVHRDLDFDLPAQGSHFLTRVRQGLARAQTALGTRDTRIPLPASASMAILGDGEAAVAAAFDRGPREARLQRLGRLRRALALTLASLFCGRQDSAVHLRTGDFGVDDDFIWLRLTEKMRRRLRWRRVVRLPLAQQPVRGQASALPRVAALARVYLCARLDFCSATGAAEPEFLFQLPGEPRPLTRHMSAWLSAALDDVGVVAQPGFAYLGHSLRSEGASCMAAIGVDRHLIVWIGGWARGSSTMERHYFDPTVLPTPDAFALWGWALTRQYAAGAAAVETSTPLPDPLVDDEPR